MTQINKLILIAAGIILLVYMGGCAYALVTKAIDFATFIGAVGTPLGMLGGWVAKAMSVPPQ